ncbi:hypothetical protein Ancab_031993, partial [Ancistrocladus abbreviatus]
YLSGVGAVCCHLSSIASGCSPKKHIGSSGFGTHFCFPCVAVVVGFAAALLAGSDSADSSAGSVVSIIYAGTAAFCWLCCVC